MGKFGSVGVEIIRVATDLLPPDGQRKGDGALVDKG